MPIIDPSAFLTQLLATAPAAVAVILTVGIFIKYLGDKETREASERGAVRKDWADLIAKNTEALEKTSSTLGEMNYTLRGLRQEIDSHHSRNDLPPRWRGAGG